MLPPYVASPADAHLLLRCFKIFALSRDPKRGLVTGLKASRIIPAMILKSIAANQTIL